MEGEYEEEVDEELPAGDAEETLQHQQQDTHGTTSEPNESMPELPSTESQVQINTTTTTTSTTSNITKGLLPLPTPQVPKRMPAPVYDKERQERVDLAESRVAVDLYDTDAWVTIIAEAQAQPIEKVRETYERFLQVFPTAGRYWKSYAEQEMTARNFDNVEKIFSRCLTKVPNIDLWRCYINYVRIVKGEQGEARKGIKAVFEFALDHMGMDISSTQIWQDYLTFLKAEKATTHYEEGQKMTAIRTLYQRAIANPMHNLESLWKDYDTFENGLNKMLAESLLKSHSPIYSGARRIYRERRALMEGILRNMIARPPRGSSKEEQQAAAWRKLLSFEKSNPQNLDVLKLRMRVTFTYNQCLLCLYHYPDMWLEAASFQIEMGAIDNAVEVYERAITAIPSCLLIYFAYADFLEGHDRIPKAKDLYERLMLITPDPLACIQYMRFARRTEEDRTAPRKIFAKVKTTCSYHVYVALANIEFKVNKNKDAARLVFEAGFARFSSEPAFIQHYIDFMIQVSDDNNTRAFLEKVLCTIPNDKAQDVWNSFLAFEYTSAPDINTITKLERRKASAYPGADPTGVFSLVNRYKFMGMWPCNPVELEAFNYVFSVGKEESETTYSDTIDRVEGSSNTKFPRPDVSCMIVYNPEKGSHLPSFLDSPPGFGGQSMHFPEFLTKFLSLLPPPAAYQGPVIDADEMLALLRELPLPDAPPQTPSTTQGGFQQTQPVMHQPRSSSPPPFSATKKQGKRKNDSDSDEETESKLGSVNRPPTHDIYRNRQQAKLSRLK